MTTKKFGVDAVNGGKVAHVLQKDGGLDDAAGVGAAGFKDSLEVGECLVGLWDDAAIDDLGGRWDEGNAAGDEDEVAGLDGL